MTVSVINLTHVDGQPEPLVRDLDMGEALGFDRPRKIRDLIKRLKDRGELPDVYVRPTVGRTQMPNGGWRDTAVSEYLLTEEEAIVVAMRADTDRAIEVRRQIAAVYKSWRHGKLGNVNLAAIETALSKIADAIQALAASHQALVTRVERLEEIASGSPGCIGTGAASMIKARLLKCARSQDSTKWRSIRARLDADLRDAVNWHGLSRHMRTWEWLPKSRLAEVEHWLAQCERESDRVGKVLAAERQQKLFS